ncbi:macrophage migration inhibitory factor [Caerostris extrusa]|uniref:L-dopachrome isomerase n=1 Tax=Caerostris extrusa TaxID=172846 RepID=A0AAV4N2X0_CAEEX|nr:macrophage migration inhibitory factor [Caerostris extrusa]
MQHITIRTMPTFTLNTNVPKDKIPEDFLKSTAKLVAEILKKPISYVVVHVNPDQLMSWAGTSDPCAVATLGSIGSLGTSQNAKISKALFDHVKDNLGINSDRMYITYVDLERANVGYLGTTFADL